MSKKTVKSIAKEICSREGLKKQVNVAQVSEILAHLSDMLVLDQAIGSALYENGVRRLKLLAKKAKA